MEGVFTANVSVEQQVHLLAQQEVDDGKVDVAAEDALGHPFAEEADGLFGVVLAVAVHQLVDFRVFLQVLEKEFVGGVEFLRAALEELQQDFEHIVRLGLHAAQELVQLLLSPEDAGFQQLFLVRKDFVECPFGDTQRGGNVVHRHALDAGSRERLHGCIDNPSLQSLPRRGVSVVVAHLLSLIWLSTEAREHKAASFPSPGSYGGNRLCIPAFYLKRSF